MKTQKRKKLSGLELIKNILKGKSSHLGITSSEFDSISRALAEARNQCQEDFEGETLQKMACTHGVAKVARALNRVRWNVLDGSRGARKAKRRR